MSILNSKFKYSLRTTVTKDMIIRMIFYIIPLLSIVFKGIIFQGFVNNNDPYAMNFSIGYNTADPFLNYYIAFAFLFFSLSILFKGMGRIIYTFVVDFLLSLLILVDIWYFRGFNTVPSAIVLKQTANLDNMSGSISSNSRLFNRN